MCDGHPLIKPVVCKVASAEAGAIWQVMIWALAQAGDRAGKTRHHCGVIRSGAQAPLSTYPQLSPHNSTFVLHLARTAVWCQLKRTTTATAHLHNGGRVWLCIARCLEAGHRLNLELRPNVLPALAGCLARFVGRPLARPPSLLKSWICACRAMSPGSRLPGLHSLCPTCHCAILANRRRSLLQTWAAGPPRSK